MQPFEMHSKSLNKQFFPSGKRKNVTIFCVRSFKIRSLLKMHSKLSERYKLI